MGEGSGKRVAVIYASRHGSTREIAEALRDGLRERGHNAELGSVDDGVDLTAFDAAVFGSAVYMGRWMKSAREYAEARRGELSGKPLWLFSSGPIGDPPEPMEDPYGIAELKESLGARDHHLFAGKIDKSELGFAEKAVLAAVGADEGDSRDWADVKHWAATIADELARV